MGFTRKYWKDKGFEDDQIDMIIGEHQRVMADYMPKSELQGHIDTAIAALPKPTVPEVDIKATEEYKALESKYNMVQTIASDDFSTVKPKFRESVYKMLDHADKHKPYAEQLTDVRKNYEEYFLVENGAVTGANTGDNKPQFGAETKGKIPTGDKQTTFGSIWGFVPQK